MITRTIREFVFPISEIAPGVPVIIMVAPGAKIVSVTGAREDVLLYVEYATYRADMVPAQKHLMFVLAGFEFDASVNAQFLDTVVFRDGDYVVHVYDVTP